MTQRRHNTGWHQRWRLGLPLAVASTGLIAALAWQHHNVLSAVPSAVAQTVADLEPDAAAGRPAEEADEAELPPDDVEADAEAQANGRPTHAEIKERLRVERSLAQGRRPGGAKGQQAVVTDEASQPTQALEEQHQRVLATLQDDVSPSTTFIPPNGPPRMDSGDPNPDRVRSRDAEAAQ